jgi:hypothetical protein
MLSFFSSRKTARTLWPHYATKLKSSPVNFSIQTTKTGKPHSNGLGDWHCHENTHHLCASLVDSRYEKNWVSFGPPRPSKAAISPAERRITIASKARDTSFDKGSAFSRAQENAEHVGFRCALVNPIFPLAESIGEAFTMIMSRIKREG